MSAQKRALAGLHNIDWRSLRHAYGAADDVPEQLLSLAAGDDSVLGDLFGNIYHQGTVYQATTYAVPFLWRLLAAQGEVGHSGIAALLGTIAAASSNQRSTWARKTREEVWNGAAVALQLLASSNETARRGAASILACFAEQADQLATPLRGVLRRADCSLHERTCVGLALAALGSYDEGAFGPDDLGFFAEAKHLAQDAAAGDSNAVHTCLSILIETIESDPANLSDWTG